VPGKPLRASLCREGRRHLSPSACVASLQRANATIQLPRRRHWQRGSVRDDRRPRRDGSSSWQCCSSFCGYRRGAAQTHADGRRCRPRCGWNCAPRHNGVCLERGIRLARSSGAMARRRGGDHSRPRRIPSCRRHRLVERRGRGHRASPRRSRRSRPGIRWRARTGHALCLSTIAKCLTDCVATGRVIFIEPSCDRRRYAAVVQRNITRVSGVEFGDGVDVRRALKLRRDTDRRGK
jgi:hypothetical protein